MKITFPHMGNVYIAVEAFLRGLGHEPVTPPPSSRRTLELGSFHSPAEVCLPFKIALGNMLEGMAQGAEAVLMIGGWGPCRLGYYAEIQRLLLQALGREVEFITLEVPRRPYAPYAANLRKLIAPTRFSSLARGAGLSWAKLKAVEELEGLALKVRPREMRPGAATEYLQEQLERLRAAETAAEVEELRQAARRDLPQLAGRERNQPLRLGIVGEIYTVVEPFANLRLEERLGYLGVEVVRTISLVEWVTNHIFKKAAGLSSLAPLRRLAAGYLRGFIGGHGLESIARSVALARQNLDGIIHILPLSCMPEIVARGILPGLSREQGIPVLSLVVDEHTAEAGFQTRLEAFVDLVGGEWGALGTGRAVYLGVDVGSVSTNFVLLDAQAPGAAVVWKQYLRTQGAPLTALKTGLSLLKEAGDWEIRGVGTTGSGRELAGVVLGADLVKNEITAHAAAALSCDSTVATIVEIGGQDSKLIILRDGVVVDFAMNNVCAAGTGSFLDQQAHRLGIPIDEFGALALRSKNPVRIAGRCTVFAESDMVHKQQLGVDLADIVAGLCAAMVRNFLSSLAKGKELRPTVFFQGGVAANAGMRRFLEEALGYEVCVPEHYDVMGALGIALLVKKSLQAAAKTRFCGFEKILQSEVNTRSYQCRGCPNACEISEIWREGIFLASWGARCGRQGRAEQSS